MNITFLHYHLRPGGVTTVIRNAGRALATNHNIAILADFGYDERPARSRVGFLSDARTLLQRLPRAGLLHTHNIGLGKNPRLTCAVRLLAETGSARILNQVHDFPEEDRPAQLRALRHCTGTRDDAFWRRLCYYDMPNVLWAVLTTADAAKLAARGVPPSKISVLPNPVDDASFLQPAPDLAEVRSRLKAYARANRYHYHPGRMLLLSPVKVMRRKNVAEAIDLVRRLPGCQLLVSLDASSRADRAYSKALKRKIRRGRLPVVIGFGATLDDPIPLFHLADAILTTSSQEGFGYSFLEGWLCGKPVVGRDIPDVTRDFAAAGVDLGHLYSQPDASALQTILEFVQRPPRTLIARNRDAVRRQYSLAAYARRYLRLARQLMSLPLTHAPPSAHRIADPRRRN